VYKKILLGERSQMEGLNNVSNCYEKGEKRKQNKIIKTITTTKNKIKGILT
jgi:hypothetical protein